MPEQASRSSSPSSASSIRPGSRRQEQPDVSIFSHAHNFVIYGGQFTTNTYGNETLSSRTAVFALLKPFTCLDATKDASARHPPPRCHPGTREKIQSRLMQWLTNEHERWKMLWVRGFAGTGKSAVAQSFADSCDDKGILGATYFFFRAAGRNKPTTVVPTLVYQLASNVPDYRSLIERRLATSPALLENSSPVQFRKLIIEPFTTLQRECHRDPMVIILDGLDECEGENAQKEILDMISNAIHTYPNLPLRWLIFSRPEAHLENAFTRKLECGRDELMIDAECREDVEKYVMDELFEIKSAYDDVTPEDWPSQAEVQELLNVTDGLFALASTCVNYIGDCEEADPVSQFGALMAFMRHVQNAVYRNPLAMLDLLYLRILEDIPAPVWKITSRILGSLSLLNQMGPFLWLHSAQAFSNFLCLDQREFFKAVRGLSSVLRIPDPKDALRSQLQFHHASFHSFLLDPLRSGRFAIVQRQALLDIIRSAIHWYEVDITNFHINDGWAFDGYHEHDSLPGLPWASDKNRLILSQSIIKFVQRNIFDRSFPLKLSSDEILTQTSNLDFRYWDARNLFHFARTCQLDPSSSIVRIEPSNSTDHQLLRYFNVVIKNGVAKSAAFPLTPYRPYSGWVRDYFLIGHGLKSVIVWTIGSPTSGVMWHFSLRCDKEPSAAQVAEYEEYLQSIRWDEEQAELEMR